MQDANTNNPNETLAEFDAPEPEVEVLITRIIDGEATAPDRARFERLADGDARLWRTLALRQQDMYVLAGSVNDTIAVADSVELPLGRDKVRRVSWPLALSGWAAVLIVALWLGMIVSQHSAAPGNGVRVDYTPVDHYQEYVRAPFVLGELQPVVLEIEELADGRIAVRFLRRVEEVAFLDPKDLPLDDNGELTKSLPDLRAHEPKVRIWN